MIIELNNLEINTTIGHYDWEKENIRSLFMDLSIEVTSPEKDQLEFTLDYEKVQNDLRELFKEKNIDLIETVAILALEHLKNYQQIKKASIKVKKPDALQYCSEVSVSLSKIF